MLFGKQLGNDGQARFAPRLVQKLERLFAKTLEFIRGGPRLEGATAQNSGPGFGDRYGGGQQLRFALDRTRAGHHVELASANDVAAHVDGRVARMRLAADELEALLDGHHAFDLWPTHQRLQRLMRALVANCADDRPLDSAHNMRPVAELADFAQDSDLVLFRD